MREFRQVTVTKDMQTGEKSDARLDITFEDGEAYRRIHSAETDDFIEVAIPASAIEYERRVIEAMQQMHEADKLARKTA